MLSIMLASLMLATVAVPVDVQLALTPDDDLVRLRLCFSSAQPYPIAYQLEVHTLGRAGTSRSRQSGALTSGPVVQCPLNNRLGLPEGSRIEATLTWSIDGQAQPPLRQRYPATQPASPGSPEPDLPPLPRPLAPDELIVRVGSNLR